MASAAGDSFSAIVRELSDFVDNSAPSGTENVPASNKEDINERVSPNWKYYSGPYDHSQLLRRFLVTMVTVKKSPLDTVVMLLT